MTQISKYPISKPVADRIFTLFIKSIVGLKEKNEVERFLQDLLSPQERVMLVKRLAIAFLLEKGYDHRTISNILKVSLPTIVSVNKARQYGGNGYQLVIHKILKEENLQELIDKIFLSVVSLPATSKEGGGTWRYLKEEVKKKQNKRQTNF